MVAAYFAAFFLFIVLFFAFFHYSPKNRNGVAAYNAAVLVLTVSLSGYYVWDLHREMEGTVDYDWFFSIAPLAILGIAIVVLAVSALLRNYVIFRH
ncbi:MAG TPA: hypothetical protein VFG28_01975 [Syntrophales bacterium]|nr:hypothetical protein [Syntrophales bacterium]